MCEEMDNAMYYALDVECIATGKGRGDRSHVLCSLVDVKQKVILCEYFAPSSPAVNYLTELTGIKKESIANAVSFDCVRIN